MKKLFTLKIPQTGFTCWRCAQEFSSFQWENDRKLNHNPTRNIPSKVNISQHFPLAAVSLWGVDGFCASLLFYDHLNEGSDQTELTVQNIPGIFIHPSSVPPSARRILLKMGRSNVRLRACISENKCRKLKCQSFPVFTEHRDTEILQYCRGSGGTKFLHIVCHPHLRLTDCTITSFNEIKV